MGTLEFIVEIVKYGAWPIVAGLAVYFLKDKLIGIFGGGVKSAKHGDTEIHFYENKQALAPNKLEQQDLQHLIPVDPTGLRDEIEQRLNGQLTQISDDQRKIDILVKNLAQQYLINAFEKVYYYIFGSQIKLLEFLSVQLDGKAPNQSVIAFYEAAKNAHSDVYPFQQFSDYMAFLISWGLVKNEMHHWSITNHGRGFITYITAMQLDKNKVL